MAQSKKDNSSSDNYRASIPSLSDSRLIEEFLRDLESTSEQVQKLLDTVRSSEVDFAGIKVEIKLLYDNVKELSLLIRGDGSDRSLVTKIALLEQAVKELQKTVSEKDVRQSVSSLPQISPSNPQAVANDAGKWQLRVALVTGILSLIATIASALLAHHK